MHAHTEVAIQQESLSSPIDNDKERAAAIGCNDAKMTEGVSDTVTSQTKPLEENVPVAAAITYVFEILQGTHLCGNTPPRVCVCSAFTNLSVNATSWFGDIPGGSSAAAVLIVLIILCLVHFSLTGFWFHGYRVSGSSFSDRTRMKCRVSKRGSFPRYGMTPKKEHAPSDVALGARDRRRLFILVFVFVTVITIAIFIVVITLQPDRRHIELLGPGQYFVSINANRVNFHLRGSA
jgi:hypothetical protein